MLLAVDVGNTQTVLGLFDGHAKIHTWRIASDTSRTSDELEVMVAELFELKGLSLDLISAVIIASVVPHLTSEWERLSHGFAATAVLIVGPGLKTGLQVATDNPHEVGADRIANAVGAMEAYGYPVAVVDFGTATNIDIVDADARYRGGIISPGLETSAVALFSRAARLSAVDLEFPATTLGTNTKTAVQSGLLLGEAAKVDGLMQRIFVELGYSMPVVATGGLSELIAGHCACVNHVDVDLTLDGLRIIAEKQATR